MARMRSASKNMCSVRQRPMPSAPNSRAWRASRGVSALARTLQPPLGVGPAHERGKVAGELRLAHLGTADQHLPGAAVDGDHVALAAARASRPAACRPWRRSAARRHPRRTAVPCRGRRRPRGSSCRRAPSDMPAAACMPWMSSGLVSRRTRMTSRPRVRSASASSAVKTISPAAAPGRSRQAAGQDILLRVGIERRVQELVECRRDRRASPPRAW